MVHNFVSTNISSHIECFNKDKEEKKEERSNISKIVWVFCNWRHKTFWRQYSCPVEKRSQTIYRSSQFWFSHQYHVRPVIDRTKRRNTENFMYLESRRISRNLFVEKPKGLEETLKFCAISSYVAFASFTLSQLYTFRPAILFKVLYWIRKSQKCISALALLNG